MRRRARRRMARRAGKRVRTHPDCAALAWPSVSDWDGDGWSVTGPRSIFSGILLIVHPTAISRRSFVDGSLGQRRRGIPLGFNLEVFEQQPGGDAGRLEDHRQAATGMRAAPDQVNLIQVFKPIVRPQMEHLP